MLVARFVARLQQAEVRQEVHRRRTFCHSEGFSGCLFLVLKYIPNT